MGIEFQRKEYCYWCDKIEEHGGIVYDTIDGNTINLTKNIKSNTNDDNYSWHDCQFVDDCIKNGALVNIKNYRLEKKSDVEKDSQNKSTALASSSSPPRKKYKSSKDCSVSTDKKLEMNTAVQLEAIGLPDKNKSEDEENKKVITSTNDNETSQLNLSANKTPGITKGIKVVDMETLIDGTFKLLKTPDDKSKNTKNSTNKKCVNDANGTSDESLKQKIDNKPVIESLNSKNQSELLIDDLSVTDDSSNDSKPLKKLSNKMSSSRITSVENRNCKKINTNEFGERRVLGHRVREVPMATSSDDEENIEENVSSFKANNKSNLKQEILENYNHDESVIVISSDDDDDDDEDEDDETPSSSSINKPHKKCLFNTVFADIERKPK
ncbi:hypothetical protein HCN44_002326 [Aphidius gifuensis]|uniref:Uncharacterized protein n=2 Tax=Aphidius gifuensis TaxID=684658 RepID=A0A835CXK2_APHGI|nr:hypothetical protein HCN44_002326 [Aphidius gifuensis]